MTSMSDFERSSKVEFAGIYLQMMLCRYPLQLREFCAFLVYLLLSIRGITGIQVLCSANNSTYRFICNEIECLYEKKKNRGKPEREREVLCYKNIIA